MPATSPHAVPADDLSLSPWLGGGGRYTPTLPRLAMWLVANVRGPILDTGCGSGELLRLLADRGMTQLYGCDVEPDHVVLAHRRTGLDTIRVGAVEDRPFSGQTFAAITAINWLQSDWQAEYAVKAPKRPPARRRLEKVVDAVEQLLQPGAVFCWDWHGPSEGHELAVSLQFRGWTLIDKLTFATGEYPETYPIYIHAPNCSPV